MSKQQRSIENKAEKIYDNLLDDLDAYEND